MRFKDFPGGSDSKDSACNAGDLRLILGLGRSPGEGHGNPFQYSCLENPMFSGSLAATAHEVTKNWTLSFSLFRTVVYIDLMFLFCIVNLFLNLNGKS